MSRFNYRPRCEVTALFIARNKGPKESGTEPAYYLKCTNPTVRLLSGFSTLVRLFYSPQAQPHRRND